LYPRRVRQEFAEEMTAVFRQNMQAAAAGGSRDALAVLGRELRDWPINCLREHAWERNHQPLRLQGSFLSGWGAVAAAFPFLLYFLSFGPALPRSLPLVFLVAGVLAAWWQRWPGWVVSWLGFLILYGQNWLPYSLLANEPAWNTMPRLLNMLSEVAIQTGWLVVMYWVVHRWPRYGTLVFLPFLMLPWAFSMEFASGAMTAVVFSAVFLILALTAVATSIQRTTSGDIWLMYSGALLPGVLLSLGGVYFSPGMEKAWRRIGPSLMQALAPFVGILLLQSLNAWSREDGRSAQHHNRLMTWGTLLAFMALLALGRLIGPSDLEAFQVGTTPVLTAVWLLGVLLVLVGGWRPRPHFASLGKCHLAVVTVMLVLLPLLYGSSFLSNTANSLVYQHPTLSTLRNFVPALQTADSVISIVGFGGLLLLPLVIGRLRKQTAAFPASPTPAGLTAWWQRKRERREANGRSRAGWSRRKRMALLLALGSDSGLVDSRQQLGTRGSQAIDLGDVDGDGDLDAFVGNTQSNGESISNGEPNEIWLNDGDGNFSNSGQLLGQQRTYAVALGDVDDDGDLDALVGNEGADELWMNDGLGRFSHGYQSWSKRHTLAVFFSDLDGDGDLDAVTGHQALHWPLAMSMVTGCLILSVAHWIMQQYG
jgi:hypothetical protein